MTLTSTVIDWDGVPDEGRLRADWTAALSEVGAYVAAFRNGRLEMAHANPQNLGGGIKSSDVTAAAVRAFEGRRHQ